MKSILSILALSSLVSGICLANDSYRLADTIKNAVGDVNLLRAQGNLEIAPSALEALRALNFGNLVLGVDINEAASGSEKADTQGVAIESLQLTVVIDGQIYTFTDFSTKTKSVLAKGNETSRKEYYTLIGRTGSNSITGSELHNTSFDSTISIPVNINLSNATSVQLDIQLLNTNTKLGDPEAFYDETAGFEDLALLNFSDRQFLDVQAAGQAGAPLVVVNEVQSSAASYLYYPGQDRYSVVGYEDQYPNKGDYDFNDLVVAYRVSYGLTTEGKVTQVNGEGYLVARGGSYSHNWHLHMAIPTSAGIVGQISMYQPNTSETDVNYPTYVNVDSGLDIQIFSDTGITFKDDQRAFVNTEWDSQFVPGQKFAFAFDLEYPVPLSQMPSAPFDPYLYVLDTGYEIHLPGKLPRLGYSQNTALGIESFVDGQGFPFALTAPDDWQFPNEYIDLGIAYPQFIDFIGSNKDNNSDWYLNGVNSATTKYNSGKWKW